MIITSVREKYISTDTKSLWEFTQNLKPGDVNCIVGNKERKVMEVYYKLIKAFSKDRSVSYLVSKRQYGRQNMYMRHYNVSQSNPLSSFEDIELEIKGMVMRYINPVIFIKDFFKITTGSNNWQESMNSKFKEATEKLKEVAKKYKVTIYTFMLFETEDHLKKYFLSFEKYGIGLIRNKIEEFYFDKQFCLYRSKDYTYKARQRLHQQLMIAHPGLKSIENSVIVSSIVGQGKVLWFNTPYPYISIGTPFIFDKRIIPLEFKGYNVLRTSCGSLPSRYYTNDKSLKMEEKYSPKNLMRFVDNHLELISRKLNRLGLTREEALDALTGGFRKHFDRCSKLRMDKIEEDKDNIIFFTKLQYRATQAYALSDVYKNFKDKKWGFSLTATRFSKNMPLILNFNNGVDNEFIKNGNTYGEQQSYPFTNFHGIYPELAFLKNMLHPFSQFYPPFRKYPHGQLIPATLSSICFFRSKKQSQISQNDINLCRPILYDLIDYLKPPIIITYCKKAHNYFLTQKLINIESIKIPLGIKNAMVSVSKGVITINNHSIKYINLPHPINYKPYNQKEIHRAWEYCFGIY